MVVVVVGGGVKLLLFPFCRSPQDPLHCRLACPTVETIRFPANPRFCHRDRQGLHLAAYQHCLTQPHQRFFSSGSESNQGRDGGQQSASGVAVTYSNNTEISVCVTPI